MKTGPLLLTCATGLASGALVGRNLRSSQHASTMDSAAAAGAQPTSETARARGASEFADTGDDRIARLFTALKEPLALVQHYELFEATRAFTAADLPGLVKRAESLPLELKSEMMIALMVRWFELDPAAAERWMLDRPDFAWGIEAWARANPDSAIRAALAAPGSYRSRKVIAAAIEQLAGKEPKAQAAQLRELPPGVLRDQAFADVLTKWADKDPAAAFASLGEMSPGTSRDDAREKVLLKWAEKDPSKALTQLDALVPTLKAGVLGNDLVTHVAATIATKNPRLVLDWLSEIPVEFRDAPAIAAAKAWAAKEPIAALEWCMANGVEVARGMRMGFTSWMAGVLGEAIAESPAATVAWLEALPAGAERERLIERALSEVGFNSSKDKFFTSGGNLPMRLFSQLPEDAQLRAARDIGNFGSFSLAVADLNGWAQHFPAGSIRAEAVAATIGQAWQRDASRVDGILASLATPADRDAALRGLANSMSYSAPADAATRALAIGDSALRRETLGTVMKGWLDRAPEASRAWLKEDKTIPPSWKAAWLR